MASSAELFSFSRAQHRELPLFTLRDAAGREGGTRGAWQRRDLLLAVLHGPACSRCTALQHLLEARRGALVEQDVELLLLATGPDAPAGLLRDGEGHVLPSLARALGEPPGAPRLLVATRFLRIAAAFDAHAPDAGALLAEALEAMRLAQVQCEECSQPLDWDAGAP